MGGRSGCLLGLCGAGEGDRGERPEALAPPLPGTARGTPFSNPGPAGSKGATALLHDRFCRFLVPPVLADKPVLELSVSTSIPEHPFRPRRPLQCFAVTRAHRRFPDSGSRVSPLRPLASAERPLTRSRLARPHLTCCPGLRGRSGHVRLQAAAGPPSPHWLRLRSGSSSAPAPHSLLPGAGLARGRRHDSPVT